MRKLTIFTCLLVGVFTKLWGGDFVFPILTYSVQATPFSTDLGNNFAYYHVNLDLEDFTRVANRGNVNVSVEFQKGLELKANRIEKKPNGAIYYVIDFSTPVYKATVKDLAGNILLENLYGGTEETLTYGKEGSYSTSDLAEKWLNEKDQYLQRLEFQHLDFTGLEVDLRDVLEKTPIVTPIKTKTQPKPTGKGKLSKPNSEPSTKSEESILKDPFGELKEPLADEPLAKDGKAAPVDDEAYSVKKNSADQMEKEQRKMEAVKESITPVLSNRRNLVKLNIPNLAFGNLTLNYERLLSARNSVALNLGYIRPQAPISALSDFIDADEIEPGEFSGLTATLEYRIYGKKKGAGSGFYYAPYLRYANHKLGFQSDIDGNMANADTQLSTVGLGGQIGVQWLIKDRIVIDWGILGLAAQWYTFKSTFTAVGEEIDFDEIRAELEADIDDSLLSNKLEFMSDENSLQAKMPFLFGGARAYLAVGYKF